MNKARIIKSALCMTSAITVMVAARTAPAVASDKNTVNSGEVTLVNTIAEYSNNSLAGISLDFDKYYSYAVEGTIDFTQPTTPVADTQVPASSPTDVTPVDSADVAAQAPDAQPAAPVSKYADMGISIADNYVNIRSEASTDGEIVGKLYQGAAATITDTKGDWVKIKSGSVKGYIMKEYLAIGEEAEKLEGKYGKKIATVANTPTIRFREKPNTESRTLGLFAEGLSYEVLGEKNNFAKVVVGGTKGYMSLEYLEVETKFAKAVSLEEEQRAAQEAAEEEAAANRQNNNNSNSGNSGSSSGSSSGSGSSGASNNNDDDYSGGVNGYDVVAYAKRFLGNPYVYGGNSLTRGTDCSGFTKLVYAHFGYRLNRSSGGQRSDGKRVSLSNLKVGDLITYPGHVAIYIGGGNIIHASNRNTGIIITSMYYGGRPNGARRIIY